MRRALAATALLALLAGGAAACGGDDEGSGATGRGDTAVGTLEGFRDVLPAPSRSDSTPADPGAGGVEPVVVPLAGVGEDGLTGTATLLPSTDATLVQLHLDGDTGDEPRPAGLHRGSCEAPGERVHDLGFVGGDERVEPSGVTDADPSATTVPDEGDASGAGGDQGGALTRATVPEQLDRLLADGLVVAVGEPGEPAIVVACGALGDAAPDAPAATTTG
ncbi:MAG: hypothetical protein R3C15_17430 [Thermoleophilia bacterium]